MDFVPTPRGIALTVRQTLNTLPLVNVLNFDYGAIPTAGDVAEFADVASIAWGEHMVPKLSSFLYTVGFHVRSLATPESPVAEYTYPSPLAGGATSGVETSNQLALCYTLYTAIPGKSGRGRVYVGGVRLDSTGSNYAHVAWSEGVLAGLLDFKTAMEAEFGGTLAVLSRVSAGAPRTEGRLAAVTSIALRNRRVDSQRRRSPAD